ncbi:hypothetical protein Sjap_008448 [Stephania japonica]|uniref:Uncharacterized protein n=1 Tax=Stephania japonica TaxID=461633 RepID=A0AAP0JQ68_9MAGN
MKRLYIPHTLSSLHIHLFLSFFFILYAGQEGFQLVPELTTTRRHGEHLSGDSSYRMTDKGKRPTIGD